MYHLDSIIKDASSLSKIYPYFDLFLKRLHSLELSLVGYCNLECSYCYVTKWRRKHNTLVYKKECIDIDLVDKAIDEFERLASIASKNKNMALELFGGEPLLAFHHNPDIFDLLTERVRKSPYFSHISIPTNGVYYGIKDKVKDWLLRNKDIVHLSFSIDGPEELQNKQRAICKGTYDMLGIDSSNIENPDLEFINWCLSNNISVGFHPMLTPNTLKKPKEFFDFFVSLGVKDIYLLHVRNKYLFDKVSHEEVRYFADVASAYKKHNISIINFVKPNLNPINKRYFQCSIFNSLMVDVDGKINLCHRFKFLDDGDKYDLGYINEDGMFLDLEKINIWQGYDAMNKPKCNTCTFRSPVCGGDCLAETVYHHGMVEVCDSSICHANKLHMYLKFRYLNNICSEE